MSGPAPSPHARLGINLSGIVDWNTEHPFVDVFRLSRAWISQKEGQPWGKGPKLGLDDHGWVKRLDPDCLAETLILTGGHAPMGEYVCLYDGEGGIKFGGRSKVTSASPGRIVVHIDGRKEAKPTREPGAENPHGHAWLRAELPSRAILAGFPESLARVRHDPVYGLNGHQCLETRGLGGPPNA